MFEIMPFDRRTYRMSCYNPLRELEQMEKSFWGEQQVNPFRTDISETADHQGRAHRFEGRGRRQGQLHPP